ncbi:MAG TPA: ChuX/HutX family heme-like substrate-binding protein [Mesorhizobium sp.]|jgi:putative hemin transport protein|nr:ChuX/HutX family heme-like substrate-binding protein [Mesorhizobium sp.]
MRATRPEPEKIRAAGKDNPDLRERDLAQRLGISEAEFVAAHCGLSVIRIDPRVDELLPALPALGEVMALTRNESAVHEKIGPFEKVTAGRHAALVLGEQIDLRIFPKHWAFGFAVEKGVGVDVRRSLQFFDAAGDAVHKVHLRPASNREAYLTLVQRFAAADQSQTVDVQPPTPAVSRPIPRVEPQDLRDRWSAMTDVHQFVGILRALDLTRREAVHLIGTDYAWPLATDAVPAMMARSVEAGLPIMCFVGNRGCIQIHSGPISNVKPIGPWLNVMDETFHLHLRIDRIRELWAVRKPNSEGHVTSVEAYDAAGELIIQFFGKRREGEDERREWREVVEVLPLEKNQVDAA